MRLTVVNYRDWGIQLGRRFRALKLWFVIRSYGVEGLRAIIRRHVALAAELAGWVDAAPDFERLAPVLFGLVCFRYRPAGVAEEELDRLNELRKAEGERPFENPRKSTAGSLKLLDPRICGQRRLRFIGHGLGASEGINESSYHEITRKLKSWGIPVSPHTKCYDSIDEVRGLDIAITTTAATDEEAFELLFGLGMPFAQDGRPGAVDTAAEEEEERRKEEIMEIFRELYDISLRHQDPSMFPPWRPSW